MSTDTTTIQNWFDAHVDDDEILAVISVSTTEEEFPDDADKEIAIKRIARRFRSGTRQSRMSVAEEAQESFERKVSWGIQAGEDTYLFTHVTAPAMTRLRIAEKRVLDTLVNAGVANSRSEALSWCVSFVSKNEKAWPSDLRDAFKTVEKVRRDGPTGKES